MRRATFDDGSGVCTICGTQLAAGRRKTCSESCHIERNRIINRERYRRRNGIPLDAPDQRRNRAKR